MKKTIWPSLIAACLLAWLVTPAVAQGTESKLTLGLRRDFGYGGFGEIQGNFRLLISGPEDLGRVVFWMDDEPMGEITQAPWQLVFHTDNFPPGTHTMTAVGYTTSGLELRSNAIRIRFLTSKEAGGATTRLIVPLVGGILALMVLSFVITSVLSRGKAHQVPFGAPRSYGIAGGVICPRCGRPFARHLLAPNMLMGKLERCPYCGKWSIVRAASRQQLAAAEAVELQQAASGQPVSAQFDQDQLRHDLEDSRFQDQ